MGIVKRFECDLCGKDIESDKVYFTDQIDPMYEEDVECYQVTNISTPKIEMIVTILQVDDGKSKNLAKYEEDAECYTVCTNCLIKQLKKAFIREEKK